MGKTYFMYYYLLQNINMQSFRFYNVKILPIFVIQNAMNSGKLLITIALQ
jgi:hypothetical protein